MTMSKCSRGIEGDDEICSCNLQRFNFRFVVRLVGCGGQKEAVVRRADLRLLLPPWWEELEDQLSHLPAPHLSSPNGHLQLHHVVPTLQPADSTGNLKI